MRSRGTASSLTTTRPALIDVGAAGKGYLVDIVSGLLADAGHTEYIVDGGGDIRHSGDAPIRVALEHPKDPTKAIGIAHLQGGSICASATNRRTWGDGIHHVIDATTGLPTRRVIATWAVCAARPRGRRDRDRAILHGTGRIASEFDFAWVRMLSDGRVESSPEWDGELFT